MVYLAAVATGAAILFLPAQSDGRFDSLQTFWEKGFFSYRLSDPETSLFYSITFFNMGVFSYVYRLFVMNKIVKWTWQ